MIREDRRAARLLTQSGHVFLLATVTVGDQPTIVVNIERSSLVPGSELTLEPGSEPVTLSLSDGRELYMCLGEMLAASALPVATCTDGVPNCTGHVNAVDDGKDHDGSGTL